MIPVFLCSQYRSRQTRPEFRFPRFLDPWGLSQKGVFVVVPAQAGTQKPRKARLSAFAGMMPKELCDNPLGERIKVRGSNKIDSWIHRSLLRGCSSPGFLPSMFFKSAIRNPQSEIRNSRSLFTHPQLPDIFLRTIISWSKRRCF